MPITSNIFYLYSSQSHFPADILPCVGCFFGSQPPPQIFAAMAAIIHGARHKYQPRPFRHQFTLSFLRVSSLQTPCLDDPFS